MIPLQTILDRLKAHAAIADVVGDRVADYDIRRDRNEGYFDSDGEVLVSLIVDDLGELAMNQTAIAQAQDLFYVWILAPATQTGREVARTLIVDVIGVLHGFHAPNQQLVQYTRERTGLQGASVTDGIVERLTFRCLGMHAGIA